MAVNGPLCEANHEMLKALIPFNHIEVVTGAKAEAYENGILKLDQGGTKKKSHVTVSFFPSAIRKKTNCIMSSNLYSPALSFRGCQESFQYHVCHLGMLLMVANHIQ